jgi:hypothetical protein
LTSPRRQRIRRRPACRLLRSPAHRRERRRGRAYDATVDAYLGFARDTGDRLKATLKADPAMPLAHVLRGAFFLLMGKPTLLAKPPRRRLPRTNGSTARPRAV